MLRPRVLPAQEPQILPAVVGYDMVAEQYDGWHWQQFWKENEVPVVVDLVESNTREQDVILDVGCGTGTYCAELTPPRVLRGVDPSVAMLHVARRKVGRQVPLTLGSARAIPYAEGSVAATLTCRSLSHESALRPAIREMGRVVRPGGVWVVADVHGEHRYACTRIPITSGDVFIETHKRHPAELIEGATESGMWECIFAKSYFWADLAWSPSDPRFSSIDQTGMVPIFYVTMFRRVEGFNR